MTDTGSPARTHLSWVLGLGVLCVAATASADPTAVAARVVLAREPRVYVELRDSTALGSGDRVAFRLGRHELALGTVTRVLDRELAVVEITQGTLAKAKKLERLQVLAERFTAPAWPRLRVGYPAAARANLLFRCIETGFAPPAGVYGAVTHDARGARWIRDRAAALGAAWPDTLTARGFDDAADEEIALERGEIDAALFWPGELSRHMREQSRWDGHPVGTRSRGWVAAIGLEAAGRETPAVLPDSAALARFDRDLFRGDLERFTSPALRARPTGPVRFEVDPRSPGWREMQRLLDDLAPPTARHARWVVVDAPIAAADSLAAAGTLTPLFQLRCPVVCAPELRAALAALGVDALVDALECRIEEHRP